MKKAVRMILGAALSLALCVPAFAAPAITPTDPAAAAPAEDVTSKYTYAPVTILNGSTMITFAEARTVEGKAIMLSTQSWIEGNAVAAFTPNVRTEIHQIVLKPGTLITRSASVDPIEISFVSRTSDGYTVNPDKLSLYTQMFQADQLFNYPFAKAELCRFSTADGKQYYIRQETTPLLEAPAIPIAYLVKEGDTVDRIAANYYGVQGLGSALQQSNPDHFIASGGMLQAGGVLTLPVSLNGHPRLAEPLATEGELIYFVKSGDSLSAISQNCYGRPDFVDYIVQRNTERLPNPNLLNVGQLLVLPVIRTFG